MVPSYAIGTLKIVPGSVPPDSSSHIFQYIKNCTGAPNDSCTFGAYLCIVLTYTWSISDASFTFLDFSIRGSRLVFNIHHKPRNFQISWPHPLPPSLLKLHFISPLSHLLSAHLEEGNDSPCLHFPQYQPHT